MASPSDSGFAGASPPSTTPLGSSNSASPQVPSKSSKLSAAASVAPPNRTIRSAAKSKGRDIVKPSPVVYESAGGPLLRVTLKALLDLFQSKIAEPNPSHEDHQLIDQVLITHRYWSTTLEIIKCFTRAIAKAQAESSETTLLPIVLTRVCNNFKTFLTYFDVSPYDSTVDELLHTIKAAHPPLHDIVQALVTNNIAAFAKHAASVGSASQQQQQHPSSPTQSYHSKASAAAAASGSGLDSSSESSSSTASTVGASGSSGAKSASSSSRPGTPGKLRARGDSSSGSGAEQPAHPHTPHHINISTTSSTSKMATPNSAAAVAHASRAKSPAPLHHAGGSAIGLVSGSSTGTSSPSIMTPTSAHGGAHLAHANSMTAGISTRETASFDLPERPSFSAHPNTPGASSASYTHLSLTNSEMPDLDVLADQMALADWTVFSNCIVTDFMNAAFLKNKAPGGGVKSSNSVANYIEHTNLTTRWIAGKILLCPTSRARGKMISYFIRLMEALKDRQDYTGMINIFTTLNTNSIWKLRKSWKHVDSKRSKAFAKFEVIVQPMINFSGYRELLSKSKPPAVPALAILTKDLVAIEEQPTYTEDDDGNPTMYLNWVKFSQIANVLSEQFLRLTKLGYPSEPLEGLFDELYDPIKIGGNHSVINDRNREQSPSSSPSPFTSLSGNNSHNASQENSPRVLLTDEEIASIADRLDLEEQGLAPALPAHSASSATSGSNTGANAPGNSHLGPAGAAGGPGAAAGLQRRISPLRIYLGSSAMASPLLSSLAVTGSSFGASSPVQSSKKGYSGAAQPPPFTLTPSLVSYPATSASPYGSTAVTSGSIWAGMGEESVDHLPSISLLRRTITHSLCTAHSVTESLSEAQKVSYENQPIQQQRDVYIRMLRLLDLSVKYSNASIFANWNYSLAQQSGEYAAAFAAGVGTSGLESSSSGGSRNPSASPDPFYGQGSHGGHGGSMRGFKAGNSDPLSASSSGGGGSSSSYSNTFTSSLEALGPLGSKYTGPTEGITQAFSSEARALDLPNPHSHLMETLAESIRIFQKFDGVTKIRNMLRPTQQQNTSSIGHSLLSETRGVLAEFSLPVRALIHAFIATGSCYFSEIAHRASSPGGSSSSSAASQAPSTTPNVFFGCTSVVERVGISLQICIANVDSALPQGMVSLPSAGVGGSARTFVQRTLSSLPPALAELFLPFESILAATSASLGWFPEQIELDEKEKEKEKEREKKEAKKEKAEREKAEKTNDSKSTNSDEIFGDGAGSGFFSSGSSTSGALIMHLTLPLGSYASTLQSALGASQKRYLASKITGLAVEKWKVEHVVTWLYLTGMQSLCSKFESQSVSGAELADLEPQDFDSMGIRMSPLQSKTLIQNIRNLVKVGMWDGQIVGGAGDAASPGVGGAGGPGTSTSPGLHSGPLSQSSPTNLMNSRLSHADDARGSSSEEDSEDDEMQPHDTLIRKASGNRRLNLGGSTSGTSSPQRSGSLKNVIGSPVNARIRNMTRLRVLEGNKAGIISFNREVDFTLKNLLEKASLLFNPSPSYSEDTVYITYYDLDGDGVSLSTSQTFQRQAEMVWEDLRKEGSIDVVYASLTLKQTPAQIAAALAASVASNASTGASLTSSSSSGSGVGAGGAYIPPQLERGGSVASTGSAGSGGAGGISPPMAHHHSHHISHAAYFQHPAFSSTSSIYGLASSGATPLNGSAASLPSPSSPGSQAATAAAAAPTAPQVLDCEAKYGGETGIMMVLEETGRIRWISSCTQAAITTDDIVNRNIDHFVGETMYEMLSPIRASGSSSFAINSLIATDRGIINTAIAFTAVPGQAPPLWEARFTFESDSDLLSTTKTVDLPKLRDTASKSNAPILAFSQRYGLIQYSNRLALKLFACETLQGAHVSSILPHGTPSSPGDATLPIQKKDGSLAVQTFFVRQFTTSSDILVVLTATSKS